MCVYLTVQKIVEQCDCLEYLVKGGGGEWDLEKGCDSNGEYSK